MIERLSASASFRCARCDARLSWPEEATDETPITCHECGEKIGTYGDLRDQAVRAVGDRVRDTITKTVKGR